MRTNWIILLNMQDIKIQHTISERQTWVVSSWKIKYYTLQILGKESHRSYVAPNIFCRGVPICYGLCSDAPSPPLQPHAIMNAAESSVRDWFIV